MNDSQTLELAALAKQLLPKTTNAQAALLRERLAPFDDFERAKRIVKDHAVSCGDEPRLNVGHVVERMAAGGDGGRTREAHAADMIRRLALAEAERAQNAHSLEVAEAFCRDLNPAMLEEMRAAVLKSHPRLATFIGNRATLASTVLVCLIHDTYAGGLRP